MSSQSLIRYQRDITEFKKGKKISQGAFGHVYEVTELKTKKNMQQK